MIHNTDDIIVLSKQGTIPFIAKKQKMLTGYYRPPRGLRSILADVFYANFGNLALIYH